MKFQEFITGKTHAGAKVKIIWPERGKRASGFPAEYKNEMSILNANVFDFLISPNDDTECDVIVWLTGSDISML